MLASRSKHWPSNRHPHSFFPSFTFRFLYLSTLFPGLLAITFSTPDSIPADISTQITWTRDSSDAEEFGVVAKDVNSQTFGDPVAVKSDGELRGVVKIIFPSAGQFLVIAIKSPFPSKPPFGSQLSGGHQLTVTAPIPPNNPQNPGTSETDTVSTTKVESSITTATTTSTSTRSTSTSMTSSTTADNTDASESPTTSSTSSAPISSSSISSSTSSASITSTTSTPSDSSSSSSSSTLLPTTSKTEHTFTSKTSATTETSSEPPSIPTATSSPGNSDQATKNKKYGIIIGVITGIFFLTVAMMTLWRRNRLAAKRRLQDFKESWFGESREPLPVRKVSWLMSADLQSLFGINRRSMRSRSSGGSSWLVGRETPARPSALAYHGSAVV